MQTTDTATSRLTEFREAAAAVRHAHSAHSEAREAEIAAIAASRRTASTLSGAQKRYAEAEVALAAVDDAPDEPAIAVVQLRVATDDADDDLTIPRVG
jgi:hypothetical protein